MGHQISTEATAEVIHKQGFSGNISVDWEF